MMVAQVGSEISKLKHPFLQLTRDSLHPAAFRMRDSVLKCERAELHVQSVHRNRGLRHHPSRTEVNFWLCTSQITKGVANQI